MRRLKSVREVIDALGGASKVARLTNRGLTAVSNWQCRDHRFPSATYVVLRAALEERDFSAPDHLWSMDAARRA